MKDKPHPGWKQRERPGLHLIRPAETHVFHVGPTADGMRLDVFLTQKLKWRSRNSVQEMLDERQVLVSGLRRRASFRLRQGDRIEIPLPPPPEDAFRIHEIPLNILYEDDVLVVLNKQAGIVVHPTGRKRFNTLINALHLRYRRPDDPEHDVAPTLAHRIDKDTSGVLLVAKSDPVCRHLGAQFAQGRARKEYLAIVEGSPAADEIHIDAPLGRDTESEIHLKQAVRRTDGAAASTDVRVVERLGRYSLVACNPHTGKQHQIRVHLASIGHPIVCDSLYGHERGRPVTMADVHLGGDAADVLLDRQALHAHRLRVRHPITREDIEFVAPLAEDMARLLVELRRAKESSEG